jgi:two-component system sensor histidine kinase CiaH
MFHSAALKLTVWYMAIIMALSIGCSIALYNTSKSDLAHNIHRRLPLSVNELLTPDDLQNLSKLRSNQLDTDLNHLKGRLISFNILVLLVGGGVSYMLARRTLEPIEQSLEAQKRFSSDASHELRTPLTAMQAEIEVALRDPKLTKAQAAELLQSNLEEVAKLRALSEGLLSLAHNSDKQTISEPVSSKTALNEALERAGKIAQIKKIIIKNSAKDMTLKAEHHTLVELLVILIDNAVKYSPEGSTVIISSSSQQNKTGKISIKDQGAGISATDLPHIFDRFYRADASRSKINAEGYGLGLAIAKKIADSLNGSIEVKSAPNRGSTFTISIPVA